MSTPNDPQDPTSPATAAGDAADKPRVSPIGWLKLFAIMIVIPAAALALLWRGRCTESVLGEVLSADGLFAAETVTKDCGPSMKPATVVRVVQRRDGKPVDDEDVIVLHDKVPVDVAWSGAGVLDVGLPKGAVIVSRREKWHDLTVRYK